MKSMVPGPPPHRHCTSWRVKRVYLARQRCRNSWPRFFQQRLILPRTGLIYRNMGTGKFRKSQYRNSDLPSDYIYFVYADSKSRCWLGTKVGEVRIVEDDWQVDLGKAGNPLLWKQWRPLVSSLPTQKIRNRKCGWLIITIDITMLVSAQTFTRVLSMILYWFKGETVFCIQKHSSDMTHTKSEPEIILKMPV